MEKGHENAPVWITREFVAKGGTVTSPISINRKVARVFYETGSMEPDAIQHGLNATECN